MAGYLKNDEANRQAFTSDGWFCTGDLAMISEEGDIAICGRVKDLINRGGIKINPTEIENIVVGHDKVLMAAIVPMPDDVYGERACLFVVLRGDTEITLPEVTEFLERQGVAKMRWPERLEVIEEMPMTPTRKIIKGVLAARARGLA
jgi:non-ribosomal peptide synthetase component E (peptide arylation enzyme)